MANGQDVSEAFCDQLRKPQAAFQPCNNQDCPHRGMWLTGTWSECSVSCGEGFRSGQATCKHTRITGMVQALPLRVCIPRVRTLTGCSSIMSFVNTPRVLSPAVMTQRGTGPTLGQHTTSPTSDTDYDVWKWHHPSRTQPLIMHSSYSIIIFYGAILNGVCYTVAVRSLRCV
ncbi:hypothetical protein FD755_018915 [Muntiacus reevesi]|uniref:Uncharacterized protein n=1 Tax=Muntiacus reevesi TaxID=9886 RepID=A0A5N3X3Z6_MUNRE|nr:hypothetical protein FD755_018915 [Muntiacus reevesi]